MLLHIVAKRFVLRIRMDDTGNLIDADQIPRDRVRVK